MCSILSIDSEINISSEFEDLYAFYLLYYDDSVYEFAHNLLLKMDNIINILTHEITTCKYCTYIDELKHLYKRYKLYINDYNEIGTCGFNVLRIRNVINIKDKYIISLRNKMYLIHEIMETLPKKMMQNNNLNKIGEYIKNDISMKHLIKFSEKNILSNIVKNFHKTNNRYINKYYFEAKYDKISLSKIKNYNSSQDIVLYFPCKYDLLLNINNIKINNFYSKSTTNLKNGTCFYDVKKDKSWYIINKLYYNFTVMTGPSGTADVLLRLTDIFGMNTCQDKITCLKACIAHMHLDRHHSIHEILLCIDGDDILKNNNFVYSINGDISILKKLDINAYNFATKNNYYNINKKSKL